MCTADVTGLAGMTWFGIYGLKRRRVWRKVRTKHPPRDERVNCRVRTRGHWAGQSEATYYVLSIGQYQGLIESMEVKREWTMMKPFKHFFLLFRHPVYLDTVMNCLSESNDTSTMS